MLSIRDDTSRLISEFFGRTKGQEGTWLSGAWAPPVDIHETEDALILKAELPGFSKDDVKVEIKDNSLTLKGQQRETAKPKGIAIGGSNAAMGAQYAGMKAAQHLVSSQAAAI